MIKIDTITIEFDDIIWARINQLAETIKSTCHDKNFRSDMEDDGLLFEFQTDIIELNNWLSKAKVISHGSRSFGSMCFSGFYCAE